MKKDRRAGLELGPPNLLFLVVVGIAAALTTAMLKLEPPVLWEVWAGIGLIALLVGALTYRNRTAIGWAHRRLTYRRSPRNTIAIYEAEGSGFTWDGRRAATYIEVLPQAYATTVIGTDRETVIRALPMDDIREELVQFDIHCDSVTAVTVGYNYHRPSQAATAYQAAIGPVDALLYGRTFIEVSVALADSLDSVYARRGSDDIPAGVSRTVKIAAERIRRRVAHAGWNTQILSKTSLKDLHAELAAQFTPALAQEHWSSCGPKSMRAIAFTPGSHAWTTANYREWCRLNPHRQVHVVRLERLRTGGDHAEMYVGFLTADPTSLSTVTALGLRRELGQQGDIFTAALPLAQTVRPTAIRGKTLADETPFPVPLAPGGIGTFIGHTNTRAQVFVNFTVGSEPFYVFGPAIMCQQLLVWLSTSGRSIDITLPGDEWKLFASRIGATYATHRDADIIVSDNDSYTEPTHAHQVRLVWATTAPETPPAYAIVAGQEECILHTPTGQIRYRWSVSTAEESFFTIARPQRPDPAKRAPASVAPPPRTEVTTRIPPPVRQAPPNRPAPLPRADPPRHPEPPRRPEPPAGKHSAPPPRR